MSGCKRPLPIIQSISSGFWKLQMRMDTEVGSELSMSGQNGKNCNACDNLSETILFRDFVRSLVN